MKTNKSVQSELGSVLISSFLRCIWADPGISCAWKWGGGEEEGALAIETVSPLPVPTLTFLHPIPRERSKGRTSI